MVADASEPLDDLERRRVTVERMEELAGKGSTYRSGNFPPDATDRDIVWMDGKYIRWPEAGARGE